VPESDLDRFLTEVEECLREAKTASSSLDKKAWLLLAEDWMNLARNATKRDI
jgi:hypothetical protein